MTNGYSHGPSPFGHSTRRFDKPKKQGWFRRLFGGCLPVVVLVLGAPVAIAEVWRVVA